MKSNGKKATPSSNATALMLSRMCLYGARVGCTMPLILLINFLLLITYSQRDRNFIAYTWFFPIGFVFFLFHEKRTAHIAQRWYFKEQSAQF